MLKSRSLLAVFTGGFSIASVHAQHIEVDRARALLENGSVYAQRGHHAPALESYRRAIAILEDVPQTRDVIEWRARGHIAIAAYASAQGRCREFHRAMEFASMASAPALHDVARKHLIDEGCTGR